MLASIARQVHIGNTAITVVKLAGMPGFRWQTHKYVFEAPAYLNKLHQTSVLLFPVLAVMRRQTQMLRYFSSDVIGAWIRHY